MCVIIQEYDLSITECPFTLALDASCYPTSACMQQYTQQVGMQMLPDNALTYTIRCYLSLLMNVQCVAGFGNCDNNPANGCEANPSNNPSSCGTCGTNCVAPANAVAMCSGGVCGFTVRFVMFHAK
jgi:hypothetical protein